MTSPAVGLDEGPAVGVVETISVGSSEGMTLGNEENVTGGRIDGVPGESFNATIDGATLGLNELTSDGVTNAPLLGLCSEHAPHRPVQGNEGVTEGCMDATDD